MASYGRGMCPSELGEGCVLASLSRVLHSELAVPQFWYAHAMRTRVPLGGENFCRNPSGSSSIWCYTTDPAKRWEECEPLRIGQPGGVWIHWTAASTLLGDRVVLWWPYKTWAQIAELKVTYTQEGARFAPEVPAARCADGDVRAAGEEPFKENVEVYPEVYFGGTWYPICGHYFWDNDFGASGFCRQLGFEAGSKKATRIKFGYDAMPVGRCEAAHEPMSRCTGGGNKHEQLRFVLIATTTPLRAISMNPCTSYTQISYTCTYGHHVVYIRSPAIRHGIFFKNRVFRREKHYQKTEKNFPECSAFIT